MRIIAGDLRGLKLFPVTGPGIRPTADRTREALFSILGQRIAGARVLDLFAGTGALGLEALSRGAAFACFVDILPDALSLIRKNIQKCGLSSKTSLIRSDAMKSLQCCSPSSGMERFNLVFMDPPYREQAEGKVLENLHACACLEPGSLVVCEHGATKQPSFDAGIFSLEDQRRYGKTLVSFFTYML